MPKLGIFACVLALGCGVDTSTYPAGAIVYGEATPPAVPAAKQETQPPAPSAKHEWIPGHWEWTREGYVWAPGAWLERPREDSTYVWAHWAIRGRHFVWVPGYFR